MGYVINELLKLGKNQIGYTESPKGSNRTKYGNFSDTPIEKNGPYPWYNGKKNGAPWCCVGMNWEYMMVLKPLLGSYDKVRSFLGYPRPADNCAAACPYMYEYLKKKFGTVAKNKGVPGDIIFFNTSTKCGHVGRIYEVADGKYKTIEYNKGDSVAWGSYSVNSTKIYAVIHIDFSSIEPKPDPEPAPTPKPTEQKYRVKTNGSPLALRCAPHVKAANIVWMPNKSEITVSGFVKGDSVYGNDQWARATYKGKTGYCSAKWITKA